MRDFSRGILVPLCIVAVLLSHFLIEAEKSCSTSSVLGETACGANERCVAKSGETGECQCLRNYQRLDDKCILVPTTTESPIDSSTMKQDSQDSSGGGSVAAGLLIPLFLISLGVAIYFSARRYKWVQRFRQYQQNSYGNVLVARDDDDDDPPIV